MSKLKQYHYVYRISNIKENKHYYGCRTSKIEPKFDIGIKYFSSSSDKNFIKDQKENLQNYKYKIIRIYNNRKDAINLEIKLHNNFNVGISKYFYNRSKQTSIGWDTTGISFPKSEETIKKISKSLTGRQLSKEHIETIRKNSKINAIKQWKSYNSKRKNEIVSKISLKVKEHYSNLTIEEKVEKMRPLENWKNNNPELVKLNAVKAAEKRKGKNNGSAKQINIFDKDGNLKYECFGNFGNICKEFGIPHHNLKISLRKNGEPIYNSKFGETTAKKFGKEEFIGWFAKYKGEEND